MRIVTIPNQKNRVTFEPFSHDQAPVGIKKVNKFQAFIKNLFSLITCQGWAAIKYKDSESNSSCWMTRKSAVAWIKHYNPQASSNDIKGKNKILKEINDIGHARMRRQDQRGNQQFNRSGGDSEDKASQKPKKFARDYDDKFTKGEQRREPRIGGEGVPLRESDEGRADQKPPVEQKEPADPKHSEDKAGQKPEKLAFKYEGTSITFVPFEPDWRRQEPEGQKGYRVTDGYDDEGYERRDGNLTGKSLPNTQRPTRAPTAPTVPVQQVFSRGGLQIVESYPSFPKIDDRLRNDVKLKTEAQVAHWLQLQGGLQPHRKNITPSLHPNTQEHMKQVRLFQGERSELKGTNLLGRFDVVASPCLMEYDENFNRITGAGRPFFVVHAAALNIAETARAQDFNDYAKGGRLDEQKYLADTRKIASNIFKAQQALGVTNSVWVPFGMGAFHSKLAELDATYRDKNKLFALKKAMAKEIISQLPKGMNMHLCLPQPNDNYDAFEAAIAELPKDDKQRIYLHINTDATRVAQNLSNRGIKVSLVNAANRGLIGHHWYGDGARTAVDENLHRRAPLLAMISFLLNDGSEKRPRSPNELAKNVKRYGGQVFTLR